MADFLQLIISGTATGAIYALCALGFTLLWQASGTINFAQGEFVMLPAFVMLFFINTAGLPVWMAFLLTCLVAMLLLGYTFKRAIVDPLIRHGVIPLVIATLGLSYALKGVVRATGFGDTPRSFPSAVGDGSVTLGQASLTHLDIAIFSTALTVMALFFWMFNYTKTGRAMRAVGMNRRAAQLVGINLSRVQMLVWGLSGAISAVAAVLIAPKLLITADMGVVVTLAFAAAIVGGFTSLPGAVVGGFIIGITENLVGLFISSRAINVAPFAVIMLVLIFKPQGLFGGKLRVRKV